MFWRIVYTIAFKGTTVTRFAREQSRISGDTILAMNAKLFLGDRLGDKRFHLVTVTPSLYELPISVNSNLRILDQIRLLDACFRLGKIVRISFNANEAASSVYTSHSGRAATHSVVKNGLAFITRCPNQAFH